VFHERVAHEGFEPFDVIAVYSFEGAKVARVEFIR
jgi:hypothetical protein